MALEPRPSGIVRFGTFEADLRSGELRKQGKRIKIQEQPFHVLTVLLQRPGEVVTREELRNQNWPPDTFVDFDNSLNTAINKLRDTLGDSANSPRFIETLPRRGYRFIAPVVSEQESKPPVCGEESKTAENQPARKSRTRRWLVFAALMTLISLALAYVALHIRARDVGHSKINSLAVLPLKNLSGDPAQEYLADGMTEELIGRLTGIRDLRVISRTSVMGFKDTKLTLPQIAKILNVDALVEGSVIRDGNHIRVHAQLIRAATDEHFWSETYDRQIEDVLALQSDVAQAIAERIAVTITGQEHSRLIAARQVAPEVYESYLKGQFSARNTRTELEASIPYFQDAIRKDPAFAPAYVGLASTYAGLASIFVGGPPSELRPKVITTAQKALELDPELAEAHVLLADMYLRQWQWGRAEAEYKRALQLKPSDAAAHRGFADWLLCQGRLEEALAWARRGRELDPLGDIADEIGWILFQARRYSESIRELRSYLAVHPNAAFARWHLGFALIGNGQPEHAIPELEQTVSLMHRSPGSLELLATAYGYAGRRAEALSLMNELKQRRRRSYIPAGSLINPHLAIREYNEAFLWFEQAYKEQSSILMFLKVHPFFDPVRNDPRFKDLLRRVGLS
jgi:TolB-like protein/DNA-binding winged helix-turn-helix (wHTH) protein/Flp pilus assembly protein TadD